MSARFRRAGLAPSGYGSKPVASGSSTVDYCLAFNDGVPSIAAELHYAPYP